MKQEKKKYKKAPLVKRGVFLSILKKRIWIGALAVLFLLGIFLPWGVNFVKARLSVKQDMQAVDACADLQSLAFSVDRDQGGLNCYLRVNAADIQRAEQPFSKALALSLDAFFTGIKVSPDKLWVNLSYFEPTRVVDSRIADTLTGRVLMYSDLRLKQDIGRLMHPLSSQLGTRFWKAVQQKAAQLGVPGNVVVINRVWIEPAQAYYYQVPGSAGALNCSLRVFQELSSKPSSIHADTGQVTELQNYANALFAKNILPVLNERINQGKDYAPLRCVYKGLVLAKVYKDRLSKQDLDYLRLAADNSVLSEGQSGCFVSSAAQTYREYMKEIKRMRSVVNGEQDYSQGITFTNYFIGGVDFRDINVRAISDSNFARGRQGSLDLSFRISAEEISAVNLPAALSARIHTALKLENLLSAQVFPRPSTSNLEILIKRAKGDRPSNSGL